MWLEFEALRVQTVELKEERERKKKALDDATTNLPSLQRADETVVSSLEALRTRVAKKEQDYKSLSEKSTKATNRANKSLDAAEVHTETLEGLEER